MLIKQVVFFGKTAAGAIGAQPLFGNSGAFEKVGGVRPYETWDTADHLKKFIKTITPEMRKKN